MKQCRDPAFNAYASGSRSIDARKHAQEGGFSRTIVTDNPNAIPIFERNRNMVESAYDNALLRRMASMQQNTKQRFAQALLHSVHGEIDHNILENDGSHSGLRPNTQCA